MSQQTTAERITYLREFLRDRLEASADGDLYLDDGDDRIIWISQGEEIEVIVITLQPGKIEVNG